MGRPVPSTLDAALDGAAARDAVAGLLGGDRDPVVEPLRRGVVRYRGAGRTVIGKVYETAAAAADAYGNMCALCDAGFNAATPHAVRIPEPYGLVEPLCLILMEDVPGRTLKTRIKERSAGAAEMTLFADALAKLHDVAHPIEPELRVEDHLARRCHGLHEAIAEDEPDLRARIERVVAAALDAEDASRHTTAHGDYHPGQVHVDRSAIRVLDLDPLHRGDPLYDVAMVRAVLDRLAETKKRPAYFRTLRDAFCERYEQRRGPADRRALSANEALVHLKRACKRYRFRDEPGWRDTVRALVDRAARCVDAG